MQKSEWIDRFKKRFLELLPGDEGFAQASAEASYDAYGDDDDYEPEEAADDEYSELCASC